MKKTTGYLEILTNNAQDTQKRHQTELGLCLNRGGKNRIYRQAEIRYPDNHCIFEHGAESRTPGYREILGPDGAATSLNALLAAGQIEAYVWGNRGQPGATIKSPDDLNMGDTPPPDVNEDTGPLCPHCGGRRTVTAFVDCADSRQSGVRTITCPECKGAGTVTPEYLERREKGSAMRDDRLARNLSLREEAERRGMKARELSDLENGRLRAEGELE